MRSIWISVPVALSLVAACGGGEDRSFSGDGGASGSGTGGSGNASGSGGSSASSGAGGSTGGVAGTGTGGASGGTGGASGGTGGASGGAGGATGGTGGATGGSGGSGTCPTTSHQCAPTPPAGWTGPVAFTKGAAAPPSCPGSYPKVGTASFASLNPGQATCDCKCDPATGITGCNTAASVWDVANSLAGCTVSPTQGTKVWEAQPGSCVKATGNTTGNVAILRPSPNSMGSCAPKPNHTIATPTWGEQARTCAGGVPDSGTCNAGETCMPQVVAPYKLCVYSPGDKPCGPVYSQKVLTYEQFTDGRTCSQCTCGTASSNCGGKVDFTSQCGGGGLLYSSVSGCGVPTADIATSQWGTYAPAPNGTCPPSAPTLSGNVTTAGETTVCCIP